MAPEAGTCDDAHYNDLPLDISAALDEDEAMSVARLGAPLDTLQRGRALDFGSAVVRDAREHASRRPFVDSFLAEFGLSNPEGVALMCMAEALLRIPDEYTLDRFIAEKLAGGDWHAHNGRAESIFVNAATWGLMLTGRLVRVPSDVEGNAGTWLARLARRIGEPVVREALRRAMKIIGQQFVVGTDIRAALERCQNDDGLSLCSFDMLGEGARSDAQARHYHGAYAAAIAAIGADARERGTEPAGLHLLHAVSIKLSALEPRFSLMHRERVLRRLVPRVIELVELAAKHGIGLTIDAEEADRLEISLEVFSAVAAHRSTREWPGLGLAVQAYGRRAPAVIDTVTRIARDQHRQTSVRLVKGAYWDSEIKRTQERGLRGYPVYTRKSSTDLSYLGCARKLFAASGFIYPQFATHNAYSIAAVLEMAPTEARFEFQRLHGMGKLLYDAVERKLSRRIPLRVYAPVGPHSDLLAYLVRRLLENGANSSFVNRFMDESVPIETVVIDPLTLTEAARAKDQITHPSLPLPSRLYGEARTNSQGADFGRRDELDALVSMAGPTTTPVTSGSVVINNPADRRESVGRVEFATARDVQSAFEIASAAQREWDESGGSYRADLLQRTADAVERERAELVHLLVREAGKTLPDAVAEIREAADFCRYYAAEARKHFSAPIRLTGPTGETNDLSLHGRGVLACISPWNFPLAIFLGQVVGALAAGNAVIAKPAETTPLIALRATELLHGIGVPRELLHCLPMTGSEFGSTALHSPQLGGVVFTGSTRTARWLNQALAAREGAILPLVAETGGLNAMIVDSSALLEQVVDDVVSSAFGSAGQRCSALRLLCVQEDVADRLTELILGAMSELVIGDPADPSTDVGPVISPQAVAALGAHVAQMRSVARVDVPVALDGRHEHGNFFAPTLVQLRSARQLSTEQFGPILHVVRYKPEELAELLSAIRASGYALTLGVQTRIDQTWREIFAGTTAGNVYVNRNMIGAVVGVQPFGGSGLSGTGPKAGGPHYLQRLAIERTLTVNTTAAGGNTTLLQVG